MLPQAIASLAAISYDPLYFGAVVTVVGLLCVVFYLALPTTTERPVWKRAALGYFIAAAHLRRRACYSFSTL